MARRDAVLDSSILIQHARERDKRRSLFARSLLAYQPHLSVISVYEIEFGAFRSGRISDIDTLRSSFEFLPLTKAIAKRAARLDADLLRQNFQIGIKDIFIAATCLEHDLPLLTINTRHFARVPQIALIDLKTLLQVSN